MKRDLHIRKKSYKQDFLKFKTKTYTMAKRDLHI